MKIILLLGFMASASFAQSVSDNTAAGAAFNLMDTKSVTYINADCPAGYTNIGPAGCYKAPFSFLGTSKMTCPAGYIKQNGALNSYRCQKNCPPRYVFENGLCRLYRNS